VLGPHKKKGRKSHPATRAGGADYPSRGFSGVAGRCQIAWHIWNIFRRVEMNFFVSK